MITPEAYAEKERTRWVNDLAQYSKPERVDILCCIAARADSMAAEISEEMNPTAPEPTPDAETAPATSEAEPGAEVASDPAAPEPESTVPGGEDPGQ